MSKIRHVIAALLAGAVVSWSAIHRAQAAENGVFDYPPGSASPFAGLFPPMPGAYLLSQGFYNPPGRLYNAQGQPSSLPIKASSEGIAYRFLFAYPGTVLGAKFYQQLILAPVNATVQSFGQTQSSFGLGNVLISPAILNWPVAPHQTATVGLDVVTPFSSYNKNAPLNVGNDHTSFQTVFAYSYFNPKGLVVGISPRFMFDTQNIATRYTNGIGFDADFTVGYKFGNFTPGIVGSFAQQLTPDQQLGHVVHGNRYASAGIGPSLTINDGPLIFNVNYQANIMARNTIRNNTLWVDVIMPLYMPHK